MFLIVNQNLVDADIVDIYDLQCSIGGVRCIDEHCMARCVCNGYHRPGHRGLIATPAY